MVQGEVRSIVFPTLGVAWLALCLVAVADYHGIGGEGPQPVALASGWGVNGVAEMASHVHAGGWDLDGDQSEEDTGYLHMFSSPVSQLTKKAQQADNTDCLEHDCSGAGSHAHSQKEERQEAREEQKEEAQNARQAKEMDKFAKMSSNVPPSVRAFLKTKEHKRQQMAQNAAPPAEHQVHTMSKVEKLVNKRQKALLAAKDTLTKIIHPKADLLSMSAASSSGSLTQAQRARIAANIQHIRTLDTIAPLPGLQRLRHTQRAQRETHMGGGKPVGINEQEKGVRLLAKKWAAKHEYQQAKMLHEAQLAQHKLLVSHQKLI